MIKDTSLKNSPLIEQIRNYLLSHLITATEDLRSDRSKLYHEVAFKFNVKPDQVRDVYRKLRKKGLVENTLVWTNPKSVGEMKLHVDEEKGEGTLTGVIAQRITTLNQLIQYCEIDTETWKIISWECNKWEVGAKNINNKIEVSPLFQVKAKMIERRAGNDLGKQKEEIIKELNNYSKTFKIPRIKTPDSNGKLLYEISLFDHHFSKLSWNDESGENYDLKIAEDRWNEAIDYFISHIPPAKVDKILLPLGNDLFHTDNKDNSTTSGTLLDADVRFFKMIKHVRRILILTVDKLLQIAPIDIVIVPGNHDYHSSLWMGEVLGAFYHNNPNVRLDIEPRTRKYYQYGKVGIQLSHGNEEPHKDLGLLFASEAKQIWYDTDFHFCQLGHFHKKKVLSYISADEFQGFEVEIMPSLSGTDAWHFRRGYRSGKAAKMIAYDKNHGKVADFPYNYINS